MNKMSTVNNDRTYERKSVNMQIKQVNLSKHER
jgi:hypothetical protein